MSKKQPFPKNEKPPPDLSEMFDLSRNRAVSGYVDRFINLIRNREAINEDIRELGAECREAMFSPVEVSAMKDIATWRVKDKAVATAAKLAALRRVSNVTKLDLFSWADEHRETKP